MPRCALQSNTRWCARIRKKMPIWRACYGACRWSGSSAASVSPAIVHLRDWKLNGFTTGSGVLAPRLSLALLEACRRKDYTAAEEVRRAFLPFEDLRDAWGAPRVLHSGVEL